MAYGLTYNGIHSDTMNVTANKTTQSILPPMISTTITVPGMPGVYYNGMRFGPRYIKVAITIASDSFTDLRTAIRAIAEWLSPENGPQELVFDNEPDKLYYAVLDEGMGGGTGTQATNLDQIVKIGSGEITFLCADPFAYSVNEQTQTLIDPSGASTANDTVTNSGSHETAPVFTVTIQQQISFLQIVSPDAYMQVGQPPDVKQVTGNPHAKVFNDTMKSLSGWTASSTVAEGYAQGSMKMTPNDDGFMVSDFGSVHPVTPDWMGPAMKKSLGTTLSGDFKVEAWVRNYTIPGTTGRVEVDLLDANSNIVARMYLEDKWIGIDQVGGMIDFGNGKGTDYLTIPKGKVKNFWGRIRCERVGNVWTFTVLSSPDSQTDVTGTWKAQYVDENNEFTQDITQVQIVLQKYDSSAADDIRFFSLSAWQYSNIGSDIPLIADVDDVIEFDHQKAVIRKNGEVWMTDKDFGATFFRLFPGDTQLAINPPDVARVDVTYRSAWL